MKWQPIETAPKDGGFVIVLIGNKAIEASWDEFLKQWSPIDLPSHGCGCCADSNPEPTHWIPLPEHENT